MMLWTTLAGDGATKILACSLMLEESTESCAWSSQCFLDCFRVAPAVIFSDSAPQLKAAVASVFPSSLHLYCIWHLSKNLVTNLKPACGADDGLWQRVCSTWWKIAKQSDVSSCATFDSDMASLGALLDESTVSSTSKSMVTARAWLAKLAEEREHWAYRFTWRTCTLGVHSTQRIEAVHAAIAHFLRASTLLTNLLPQLEAYSLNVTDRSSVRDFRFAQRLLAAADACLAHPLLTAVAPSVTAYALLLLKVQLQQASFYSAAPMLGQEGTFSVTRRPGTWGVAGSAEEQSGDADLPPRCCARRGRGRGRVAGELPVLHRRPGDAALPAAHAGWRPRHPQRRGRAPPAPAGRAYCGRGASSRHRRGGARCRSWRADWAAL